jgi:hypothetical protein
VPRKSRLFSLMISLRERLSSVMVSVPFGRPLAGLSRQ